MSVRVCVCVMHARQAVVIEAQLRQKESVWRLIKRSLYVLQSLIVAHLRPELAEAETSTSVKDPGVKFTIKTSVTRKN